MSEISDKPPGYVFGRPTVYKAEYCQMLIEHMTEGRAIDSFAGKLSVSKDTIYEWLKKHTDFADAYKIARQRCYEWWENQAREGMWSHDRGAKLNNAVWIFNMKNRFGWTDRMEVDSQVTGKVTHEHMVLSPEQARIAIKEIELLELEDED